MILIYILLVITFSVVLFMRLPKFGRVPLGQRKERIVRSANYRDGRFQNVEHTPALTEGTSYWQVMKYFFFAPNKGVKPVEELPSRKEDLKGLDPDKDVIVWFGHSAYYMQAGGKKILVDPVFSGAASPVKFTTRSFKGSDVYNVDDMPGIDYLFLTHDHWDHLDYETVIKLKPKVKQVITSLGVGAHLERWGFDPNMVHEMDWGDELLLTEGFKVNAVTSRHFSGRGFKREQTLWSSFAFTTPGMKIFIGGDSGYGTHFKKIGAELGPFDIAILECGQYDAHWKYIHMMPEETVQAAKDLHAKILMPVHWGKFALAKHEWDSPIKRVVAAAEKEHMPLLTPLIGEAVSLNQPGYKAWWKGVK